MASVLPSLRNVFPYDRPQFPFCDAFSQFSVGFLPHRAVGLGFLHPRAMLSTYEIAEPVLELWLEDAATGWAPFSRRELESQPWAATESGAGGGLSARAEHIFRTERSLVSVFTIENTSDVPVRVRPAFLGTVQAEKGRYMLPYFDGPMPGPRHAYAETVEGGLELGLRAANAAEGLWPQVGFRLDCADATLKPWIGETPVWANPGTQGLAALEAKAGRGVAYAFVTPETRELAPKDSVSYAFLLRFAAANPSKALSWPGKSGDWANIAALRAEAEKRFWCAFNPETLPKTGSALLDQKAAEARFGLLRDGLSGCGGEFEDHIASLCTSDTSDFSCVFFWDSFFSSVAIKDFNADYAKGTIHATFTRQDKEHGAAPERKWNYATPLRMVQNHPQSPVASWAVEEFLKRYPQDEAFLQAIYPKLVANHRFWEKHSDYDGDGLVEYRWSGQVADNSPLWDPYASLDKTSGCGWLPPVASVAGNCFVFKDAKHLEKLARRLGREGDARHYAQRAEAIQRRLFEVCYVPGERRFWDYNQLTRTYRRVKTFYMFWPLYAGMDVPEDVAKDLIENVLLDPKQFFGAVPFPSVAYDEPEYDAKGYWRGKAWPHICYWLLQTLVRYGYEAEAKEAARRILAWYSTQPFLENLATDPMTVRPGGFANYNWGNAAFMLIAAGSYLDK